MDISKIDPWVDPAPSNAYTLSLNKLRQKIKKKKPWAYRHLALRHEYGGIGVKKSMKEAIDNHKKGTKLGDPDCMLRLGYIYEQGMGVAKNAKLAIYIVKIIILIGAFLGCNNNLILGLGLIVMAIDNYKNGMKLGDRKCRLCLGYINDCKRGRSKMHVMFGLYLRLYIGV